MMAGRRGSAEDATVSRSSTSSSLSSSKSDSEGNSTDATGTNSVDLPTSGSEGDLQISADEGIYGWILYLIKEGKVARVVDGAQGIYQLDWQTVVSKYWFEYKIARNHLKSKSVNKTKFSHRTASNRLRSSLLNAYKDKGAKEYSEKKVLDNRNRTMKRCFRLPSTVIHKLARYDKETNITTAPDDPKKSPAQEQHVEGSLEENIVKEIDPCEGPYQGGNAAFIFLEDSLRSRFGSDDNMHTCKVVFYAPGQGLQTAHTEVTATVKNCFSIKVYVPRCPSLAQGQLACGKVTVRVLVITIEGRYIGETRYTYSVDLLAQLEHYVKVLDDEDMDMDFSVSPTDEQQIKLNCEHPELSGSWLFNIASVRVLVFVAVKEKACNFLSAFLDSPAALPVLQQCKSKLLSFLDRVRRSDRKNNRQTSVSVLDMCEKLIEEFTFEHEATRQGDSVTWSQGSASEDEKEKEKQKEYDSSSEFDTSQELEALTKEWSESAVLEPKASAPRCENNEYCLNVEHRNAVREGNEEAKDMIINPTCSLNLAGAKSLQVKEGKKEVNDRASNQTKIFVVRKPCSPVPISRSRFSFPNPRTDVFVELQVRKSQRALDETEEAGEHVTVTKQHVTEHVPVTKHHVIVDVRHSETEQSAKDWESKYVKRVSGKLGYWFRFYQPNCELLLVFTLCDKPHVSTKPETKPKSAACKVLDHVTVVVKTTNWKGPSAKEAKAEKEPCKLALTREVPLVTLSRSQNKLCEIMNGLHKLCDNGDWTRFEKECVNLQCHSTSADIHVAILLEKAIAFLYQHDLEKAESTALEALKIASKSENHQLLAGRAYYYLAHVYRRERKLGEAERCIDLSKQNLHLIDVCLDQSFMAYEEGNVMKDFVSGGAVLRKTLLLRAKQCFERCLDLSRRLDDSDSSVIPATHSFALIKIAMLLLDCGSTSGRERCVSSSHIQEAERFLELLQKRGLDEITERRKIQFLLARSDLQYRMNNYQTAIRDAETALEKAKELGFMLEVMPARNRLNHICQLLDSGGCVQYTNPYL